MKKWFVYLSSVWGVGLGIRFIYSYFQNVTYKINTLDVFFDWGILLVSSLIVLTLTIYESFKEMRKNERKVSRLRFQK